MTDRAPSGRLAVPRLDRRVRWGVVAAVAAVVLAASVVDPGTRPRGEPRPDGPLHVLAYAALGLSLAYATAGWSRTVRRVTVVLCGATAYGLAVELLQVPIPYRAFSRADVLANAAGAGLSLLWLAAERSLGYADPE